MIHVQFMKPFYTKVTGDQLRLVFAYQYFSILKDDEIFHFIPIEGKEMIVNLQTMQVENLSEVFVFQKGNRFIRLPLYQLLLISNVHDHLVPILENSAPPVEEIEEKSAERTELDNIITQLERENIIRLIDEALAQNDKESFERLAEQLKMLDGGATIE
ncbi:MAG: IDEAL domain-containing protein [Caryophanon sp.]|nr:IDEAL domain-containing protein [Caryophanon sp.]